MDINPNNLGAAMTQMFSAIPRISVSLQPTSSVPYHAIFKVLQVGDLLTVSFLVPDSVL